MCKFSRTLHNGQFIQFVRIPVQFVVRFIRYQNPVKVITFSIALISPYSWCSRNLRLQCLELHTACILSQYHWDKEFHFPGKFRFLVKTTDSVRLGVVYLNLLFSRANGVMFCESYLHSVAHITTIYLFILFSICLNRSSISYSPLPILDPRSWFSSKSRSLTHSEVVACFKVINAFKRCGPTRSGKARYGCSRGCKWSAWQSSTKLPE